MLNHLRPRFILDAYKMGPNGLTPLNEGERNKFCTQEQADELLKLLSSEVHDAKLVDTMPKDFVGDIFLNYRDDSDPTNLKCLSISASTKIFQGYDPTNGEPKTIDGTTVQNCGELLWLKKTSNGDKLVVNQGGMLVWG